MKSKYFYIFTILSIITIIFVILDLFLGSVKIPVIDIIKIIFGYETSNPQFKIIIFEFRIPKVITAILAGSALSVSGLQMQTIFRNPLAGPFVLGISAGASLGVAIVVLGFSSFFVANISGFLGSWSIAIASWLGSGLILLLILIVSLRVKDIMTILIFGIMFGSATIAIVSILQYFSSESMLKAFIIWTMGNLGGVTNSHLQILAPSIIFALILSFFSAKMLNAMLLGENYAKSMGLNIRLARISVFLSTSILAGSVTAFCGPIGFIGIAVPHITRMIFKTANHNFLIPATIFVGSIVMLISDIISQLPGTESNLPINSITALIGIPVILWMIIKNQKLVHFS
ncbi:MAG: iron ABC transporter permease [Bacteroidetes bacterium]|jgi:iron complex transport system permease protein|nr:iron ABC transporter permease [Bacteroidota bacterium]MBT6687220.1 iron ABC transporter permease [Bacteroidota bacterium]MBT7144585.1 iron ABC transporter permease [Bacteroidota bacterium]MBT7490785.1 iron ABC transporter permease [Bacteroidota bacterium]